jgi:mercuric reductase
VGCVPSKTLLAAAGLRHAARTNPHAGVALSADGVDLAALVAQKDHLIAGMRQAK